MTRKNSSAPLALRAITCASSRVGYVTVTIIVAIGRTNYSVPVSDK